MKFIRAPASEQESLTAGISDFPAIANRLKTGSDSEVSPRIFWINQHVTH